MMELVISALLIALALIVIVGVIPMGVNSLKKSESIQAATLYAVEVVEDSKRDGFRPTADQLLFERDVEINKIRYHVTREIYSADGDNPPSLYDVVVHVSWQPQPVPVELRTRVYRKP